VNDEAFARLWRRRIVGDPKTAKERLDAVSPLQHAAGIKAPVLIAHGDRDIRVPISHSERMVEALKREHKDVQWLQLQGEGHAITGALNVARYYDALFKFLDEHIGSGAPAAGVAPAASATASP
jgi:dipeptidyl aminopeptidase/acylaminoacyl peptidase